MNSRNKNPLVSVVIPTYNQPEFLLEALRSVFSQTFTDFEVIVVDDGSTDDTATHLAPFLDRVKLLRQANKGIGAARNAGVALAKGKYVAFLDHDDIWATEKLEIQVRFLESHPTCTGCSVPYATSMAPSRPYFNTLIARPDGVMHSPLGLYATGEMFMLSSAMMIRAEAAKLFPFEEERGIFEDLPMHIRLLLSGPYGIAGNKLLAVYRQHPGNTTKSADHFERGLAHLRRLQTRKDLGARSQLDSMLIDRFICVFGRITAFKLLRAGRRLDALRIFASELPHQVRWLRLRFVLGFPLMAIAPNAMVRRFSDDRS